MIRWGKAGNGFDTYVYGWEIGHGHNREGRLSYVRARFGPDFTTVGLLPIGYQPTAEELNLSAAASWQSEPDVVFEDEEDEPELPERSGDWILYHPPPAQEGYRIFPVTDQSSTFGSYNTTRMQSAGNFDSIITEPASQYESERMAAWEIALMRALDNAAGRERE